MGFGNDNIQIEVLNWPRDQLCCIVWADRTWVWFQLLLFFLKIKNQVIEFGFICVCMRLGLVSYLYA
jgi:hypothetical protein